MHGTNSSKYFFLFECSFAFNNMNAIAMLPKSNEEIINSNYNYYESHLLLASSMGSTQIWAMTWLLSNEASHVKFQFI